MLARLRNAQEEREGGFTLIELLVVMIIIGILAAIAIPVFLSQRQKAQDTAAKADVSTLGKEIAAYYVDNTGTVSVAIVSNRYQVNSIDSGKVSNGVSLVDNTGAAVTSLAVGSNTAGGAAPAGVTPQTGGWCVAVSNTGGQQQTYKYSSSNGLEKGLCSQPYQP